MLIFNKNFSNTKSIFYGFYSIPQIKVEIVIAIPINIVKNNKFIKFPRLNPLKEDKLPINDIPAIISIGKPNEIDLKNFCFLSVNTYEFLNKSITTSTNKTYITSNKSSVPYL